MGRFIETENRFEVTRAGLEEEVVERYCSIVTESQCEKMKKFWRYCTSTIPWDFPGGPVIKTLCFQCRGRRFDPWSGN